MFLFGKKRRDYVSFTRTGMILIVLMGLIHFMVGIAGVPYERVTHLVSMTILTSLLFVVYGQKAAANGFGTYQISGPLMDSIDIQMDVSAVPYKELSNTRHAESSETIRHRVVTARNVQLRRFFDEHIYTNAQMGPRHLRKHCVLTPEYEKIMENAVTKLGFSARGYDRILKRSRTTRGASCSRDHWQTTARALAAGERHGFHHGNG